MKSISEALKQKRDFYCEKGATTELITKAEEALGLNFAEDYREYLCQFGSVSCSGHELTGFSEETNLDVVKVTMENRKKNPNVDMPLYVVEETHMDGIVIWQAPSGEIFQTEYKDTPYKIYNSLLEYVDTFENGG